MFRRQLQKILPKRVNNTGLDIYLWCAGTINKVFLRGSTFTCIFCHHSFRKFLPIGLKHSVLKEKKVIAGGYRTNAVCPFCGSLDRERLVYLFLTSYGQIEPNGGTPASKSDSAGHQDYLLKPGMRLLHIAPERNLQRFIKKKGVEYFSGDLGSPLAEIKMDIQHIPFADAYFDAIICNHVLEHIPNDISAMKEIRRVLKKGGWAILQVPYSPIFDQTFENASITSRKQKEIVFGQRDHVRIYGLDYPHRLESAGFSVIKEKIDAELILKFALNPLEEIFFCSAC